MTLFKGHITKGKVADKWIWLRGPKGAVALGIWKTRSLCKPISGVVWWHSLEPIPGFPAEHQDNCCQFLEDQPCHSGGSAERADYMIDCYSHNDMMRVWFDLKAYYEEIFDKEH